MLCYFRDWCNKGLWIIFLSNLHGRKTSFPSSRFSIFLFISVLYLMYCIIWLASCTDKMNCYLVCSGFPVVSCKEIVLFLLVINPLLTKLVQSRWLDIGLILFCMFTNKDSVSVLKHAKKNLANIQPSWPQAWSKTQLLFIYTHHDSRGIQKHPLTLRQKSWTTS